MPSLGFRRALLAESKHKWATFNGMTGTTGRAVLSIGAKSLLHSFTRQGSQFYFWARISPPDPEHVPIRMPQVHLADVPRHIGGRKCDLQSGGHAMLVHLVHVVHPDRHPDALVALFVSVLLKRCGVRAAAAASLRPLTKKDASFFTRSNRAKRRRRSPVPQFLPSPLLKPRDRAGDIRHVQYRSQTFD